MSAAGRLIAKGLMRAGDSLSTRDDPDERHLAFYQDRADVGAVLIFHPPWANALGLVQRDMPGLFDEQVRHLGRKVACFSPVALKSGDNAFLLEDGVLCFGMTLERLIFNAELLEKCAKAFLLAHSTGAKLTLVPWWVRMIAGKRLLRDEMFAAACHADGIKPIFKSAY
jgi:ribulose-5-phosphate 4-epimerase/fuculose-1-phosphate aldolase